MLFEIGDIGIKNAPAAQCRGAFRERTGSDKLADGRAAHVQVFGNAQHGNALLVERHDFLITGLAPQACHVGSHLLRLAAPSLGTRTTRKARGPLALLERLMSPP